MTVGSWGMLALLGLVPLLVLIYFLKLRRPQLAVPSLVLWRRVLADPRVNSPFQRFRRHLLLWLQLALLLLLIAAALLPALVGVGGAGGGRVAVLVDVSASMAARTAPGGPTRLEAVQEQLREAIGRMAHGEEWVVIAVADRAWRVCEATDHPGFLRGAIASLQLREVPGRLDEGLRLAQALGQGSGLAAVRLYSDGNLPEQVEVELATELDYRLVPPGGANLGIVAASARRLPGRWELLVSVVAGSDPASGLLRVADAAGTTVHEERLACAQDEVRRVLVRLRDGALDDATALHIGLQSDGFDALASDDAVRLDLPPARPLRVAVADGLPAWRRALQQLEDLVLVEADAVPDLLITDQAAQLDLPAALRCSVGLLPPALDGLASVVATPGAVVDWQRTHPVLRHVELAELGLLDSIRWRDGEAEAAAGLRGLAVLVHGRDGPLVMTGDAGRSLHWLVRTDRSTLPYRVGFPVHIANLVAETRRQLGLGEVEARRTGPGAIDQLPGPDGEWELRGPDGTRAQVPARDGRINGVDLPVAGTWELHGPGGDAQRLGAALLSAAESRLTVTDELQFSDLRVGAGLGRDGGAWPLWPLLALLGLGVLLAEWAVFAGRPRRA